MRHSLSKRVLAVVVLFAAVIDFCCIFMNYRNFVNTQEKASFDTASTVANTCVLVIDSDKISDYISTGNRDTSYYEVWNKLLDYRNTNEDIQKLSVVFFTKEACSYIYDTDLAKDGAFLLDYREYDEKQKEKKEALLLGEEIGYLNYGTHLDVYKPVLSSYNIPVGYVVVGISTEAAVWEQCQYLIRTALVILMLSGLMLWIIMGILVKTVIRPINQLSYAAVHYAGSLGQKNQLSELEQLKIKTGDEVEKLYLSIQKMAKDIMNTAENLMRSDWDKNHDGMTQLYNKRHYLENRLEYNQKKQKAAIYLDIDNLKKMNDLNGHEAGDAMIIKAAHFLSSYDGEGRFCYRMGGDEFLMVLLDCTKEEAGQLEAEMKADSNRILSTPESSVQCRAAIGSFWDGEGGNIDRIVELADKKMYEDKKGKR